MYKLAVCIPTYRRPAMLKTLLEALVRCNIDENTVEEVNVIVVDNDDDKSAESAVSEYKSAYVTPFRLFYFSYPVKGLSNVRNELIERSLDTGSDFILFIDDDEYPDAGWINELLKVVSLNNADMARGPVISVFEKETPEKIRYWFKRKEHKNNALIKAVATNNLIIKTETLKRLNIRFDERFNYTGSEDAYFGMRMADAGATTYWASKAVVYENIPYERTKLFWLMKRKHRGATNFIYKMKIERNYLRLAYKFTVSLAYIITGTAGLILTLLPLRIRYWGLLTLAEGIGGISGLLNFRPEGY